MVRLASKPSIGPGMSAPSSEDEAWPTPEASAPEFWLVFVAFASGFLFFGHPVRATDAASTTNSTSDLRITFRSQYPHRHAAGRFLSHTGFSFTNLARRRVATGPIFRTAPLWSERPPHRFPHLPLIRFQS